MRKRNVTGREKNNTQSILAKLPEVYHISHQHQTNRKLLRNDAGCFWKSTLFFSFRFPLFLVPLRSFCTARLVKAEGTRRGVILCWRGTNGRECKPSAYISVRFVVRFRMLFYLLVSQTSGTDLFFFSKAWTLACSVLFLSLSESSGGFLGFFYGLELFILTPSGDVIRMDLCFIK